MEVMFDSVDLAEIPRSASAVGAYGGGRWPTYVEAKRRWPHAHILGIAVNAGEHRAANGDPLTCLDVEPGDAVPAQAPGWYFEQRKLGVFRPCLYGSLSWVPQIMEAMQRAGIARHEYAIWSAHYTFRAHICGPDCGLPVAADGTQWTDRALGRNLDESLLNDAFFGAQRKPVPNLAVLTPVERREARLYDRLAEHPRRHPHAVRKVQGRLVALRKAIWQAAETEIRHGRSKGSAWRFRDRGARYALLWSRTRGL